MTSNHSSHVHSVAATAQTGALPASRTISSRVQAVWHTVVGAVGVVMGLLPHVLHHVGILAGTALVAGSGGTALFGVLGLVASIPMLVRLRRRFGSWIAPAVGLVVYAAMFSLSAFVIGPAVSGFDVDVAPGPVPTVEHTAGHTGGH